MLTNQTKCVNLKLSKYKSRRTEMQKEFDCPLCNGGKIKINTSNGYRVITNGYMNKLPCVTVCNVCNRRVKYLLVKEEDYEKALKEVQTK